MLSVFANLQSMTNGNTSYHTDLPVFPQQASRMEATCTVMRHISEVPSRWRALENERSKELHRWSENVRTV